MVDAQRSLFRQLDAQDKTIAELTKERDDCRKACKIAEARAVELRNQLNGHHKVIAQRDRLLLEAAERHLAKPGESSLNTK